MNFSDLIGIGRLGGVDADGFYQVLIKPRFKAVFAETDDIFLIFNSDRVFFVTISERDISDRKTRVKFLEDGIAEERKLHHEVIIAIASEPEEADAPDELVGYTVLSEDKEIGRVKDYFHNHAQFVLVVETPDGREILVPRVDYFINAILPDPGVVILHNAESLIAEALK